MSPNDSRAIRQGHHPRNDHPGRTPETTSGTGGPLVPPPAWDSEFPPRIVCRGKGVRS